MKGGVRPTAEQREIGEIKQKIIIPASERREEAGRQKDIVLLHPLSGQGL